MSDHSSTKTPAAFTTLTFNSNMEPLEDLSHYPIYCRKGGKETKSHPIQRARQIFDLGTISRPEQRCTNCIGLNQDCVRFGSKFTKCCWCTAEDWHPAGLCHLPGEVSPVELSATAKAKKRKLESMLEAESNKSVSPYGQSHFQLARPHNPVRRPSRNRKPEPGSPMVIESDTPMPMHTFGSAQKYQGPRLLPIPTQSIPYSPPIRLAPIRIPESNMKSERITVLENQVSTLSETVAELRSMLEEMKSVVASDCKTPKAMTNARIADCSMEDCTSIDDINVPVREQSLEHTVFQFQDSQPINGP